MSQDRKISPHGIGMIFLRICIGFVCIMVFTYVAMWLFRWIGLL